MPTTRRNLLLACCCLVLTSAAAWAADAEGFKPLFDGKTFDGWEGSQEVFRIEDGAIVGGSLKKPCRKRVPLHQARIRRLRVAAEVQAAGQGRQRRRADPQPAHAQEPRNDAATRPTWATATGAASTTSRGGTRCWPARRPPIAARRVKRDDWNEYVIRCEGRRIQLWINGQQTVDYTEPDESIPQSGLIGLQIHGGGPSEAWYKDVAIKELGGK